MTVDYYSLLSRAVAGKDATARDRVYRDAHNVINTSHLAPEAASSHLAALEHAIVRIENEIVGEQPHQEESAAAVSKVLLPGRNWKPLAVTACALVAGLALSVFLYEYVGTKGPPIPGGASALSRQTPRGREDVVMPDLRPGVDGGSSSAELPFALQRQVVFYRTTVVPGSIVVDRENRFLYLVHSNNSARRYGIGIAQECLNAGSLFLVKSKLEWPDWQPSAAGKDSSKLLPATGNPGSPLGARALLLDKPGLIIHGTNTPKTIGHLVASGCIRLVNDDVEDLYRRVSLESRVIFIS